MTKALYVEDPYLRQCEATVTEVRPAGVILDQTIFYPVGGGQPGDQGQLSAQGRTWAVTDTRREGDGSVVHIVDDLTGLEPGMPVSAELDWSRRHQHMRMHTALHLLGSLIPAPVTGGNISAAKSRLDFDTDLALDKAALTEGLNALVEKDIEVGSRWITQEELQAQPELIRTMSVKPPGNVPRIRLLDIPGVDLQPCGGTHVARTGEIGVLRVSKIENKGKHNRRVNVVFDH